MHPLPKGYAKVNDGEIIQKDDLALGKVIATCGQQSYGWTKISPQLVGQEYFEGATEMGHPVILVRKTNNL